MKNYKFIRFIEFGDLFELFFFSAILTLIAIRIYLQLTGFPQIGSGIFHIAHLLFGGFFMLFSILGLLTFLNNDLKPYWAILGGIGFGTFIDEIGKFLTRDNDYFFQPTFAIIYVIFILLYLLYKSIERIQIFTPEEYLINSINLLEDLEIRNLDKEEKEDALEYLAKSNKKNNIVVFLKKVFSGNIDLPDQSPSSYESLKRKIRRLYRFFLHKSWSEYVIAAFFIARSLLYISTGVSLIYSINNHMAAGTVSSLLNSHGLPELIKTFALISQAILTIIGAIIITRSRKRAYKFFRAGVLVSIFILQVFNFYSNPLYALFSTAGDLLLLGALSYVIRVEK
ncbi:MAG TPA: hypothetical protein VLG50_01505 [Candidatus Saccharimonadales bacterium]|nr:hypothetical protein [Candidatus Saccharimonadales bacterium]